MPQTFDGMDFDIHQFSEPLNSKVLRVKERINPKMKKDLKKTVKEKNKKKEKSLIIALASNIVLPGLGSVYLKRTFFGIAILSLNFLFLLLGVSFFNILTSSFFYVPSLEIYASQGVYFGSAVEKFVFFPKEFTVLVGWSLILATIAWLHLFYLFLKNRGELEFIP